MSLDRRCAALAALALALAGSTPRTAMAQDPAAAVDALRGGARFRGDPRPFLDAQGRLDPAALRLLRAALREVDDDPREEVARALVAAALAADPAAAAGGCAVRDPEVLAALAGDGVRAADGAREVCLTALLESAPPAALRPHGAALAALLAAEPDATLALVVAKAKPAEGRDALERAARADPDLGRSREVALARAALGDAAAERRLVEAFAREARPAAKAAQARELGLVGTPAALAALAAELRTPLVITSLAGRRSVRLDVIAALRGSFPEEPSLCASRIVDDAGYAAVERFAEQRLGVTPSRPRPPFLTEEPAPAAPPR